MTKCTGAAKYVLTGVIAATIFLPSAGFAQQTAASEESDEIIVTARKVTERLSAVATSIAVLDQRTLSERGLTDVASVNSVVTNFSVQQKQQPGTVFVNILRLRSEESRVGKECVSTCRSRCAPD